MIEFVSSNARVDPVALVSKLYAPEEILRTWAVVCAADAPVILASESVYAFSFPFEGAETALKTVISVESVLASFVTLTLALSPR